jgi:DNA replication and repair protein RecF
MQLLALQLENFRNYEDLQIDLVDGESLALIGQNAQGKTNLLESIAFLALGKSFRTRHSMESLTWDRPHGRIRGTIASREAQDQTKLEVFFQRSPEMRKVKKQDQIVTPKNFLGSLRVVIFTPDDMQLISGSPSLRRQYMDRTLIQLDRQYLESFATYQKLLKQRNALLKQIQQRVSKEWELDMWDARLVTEAEVIWQKREAFIRYLCSVLRDFYKQISGNEENLFLRYNSQQERFAERLTAHRESDIRSGATSIGPHRDDFTLLLDDRDLAEFGSRGECRSAVLSLKLAEIHYIEKQSKSRPLLLLDDVFSELDTSRREKLSALLQGYQSIITTTCADHVSALKNTKIYEVAGGSLTEVKS